MQVQNGAQGAIAAQPVVRFATTLGIIEPTARLTNGTARVLLRSSATPGTAIITAFVGNSREQIAVDFSNDSQGLSRFWQINGAAVSYGVEKNVITASGPCSFDFGDTHIESDTRIDIDMFGQYVWAEGNVSNVLIRQGDGLHAPQLRGDRLFFDLRRKRGVMRRTDLSLGPARQEFLGRNLAPPPGSAPAIAQAFEDKKGEAEIAPDASPIVPATSKEPPTAEPTATFSLRPASLETNERPRLLNVADDKGTVKLAESGRVAEVPKKRNPDGTVPDENRIILGRMKN